MTKPKAKTQWEVGALYTTDGKDVWRCLAYQPEPRVTMEPLNERDTTREGSVSQFSDFVRLIPETDPPKREKRKYERKAMSPPSASESRTEPRE